MVEGVECVDMVAGAESRTANSAQNILIPRGSVPSYASHRPERTT
jgi:hypothetical protein